MRSFTALLVSDDVVRFSSSFRAKRKALHVRALERAHQLGLGVRCRGRRLVAGDQ
jgi:hypothetical protein